MRRTDGKIKRTRSVEYAAIGIMNRNDMLQEGYLAFLEAYNNLDWNKVGEAHEEEQGAIIWGFLKKSTTLNFEKQLRTKKDGVRVPERALFESKSANTNLITKLFSQMEKVFANNAMEVGLTKWETDLIGAFLDVHLDEFLDLTRGGNRNVRGLEREVIKGVYGLDTVRLSYKELSDKYRISESTIRSVKERAIKKLQSKESMELIADFLHEYRIDTQADTENFRK